MEPWGKRTKGSTHYNIDGHIFHVYSWSDKKSEAEREAYWLRQHSARARVRKIGEKWATLKS
jgi:hypothetical protein